jgi:urease subunit beta
VGGVVLTSETISYNDDREPLRVTVRNLGDRPIQVGSHFHFFEVNRYLAFDRPATFGCHLNIPATTAIRFEPGEEREVELVPYAGKQRVMGFNGLVDGYAGRENAPAYYPARAKALRRMKHEGFRTLDEAESKAEYKSKKK